MVEGISGAGAPQQPIQPPSHEDMGISQQQIDQFYALAQNLKNLMPALINQAKLPEKH